jgi:imidazoleglycerol phosphate synthase glutamine amidotransferase subunit HisH
MDRIEDYFSYPDARGRFGDYGGSYVAAIERGPLLACQFHPELSGAAGLRLLRRWVELALRGETVPC